MGGCRTSHGALGQPALSGVAGFGDHILAAVPPDRPEKDDYYWMERALGLAQQAAAAGEVPVGAVIVRDGVPLGEGWNQLISAQDPTAHAEILALRMAAARLGNYRLPGCTLYVSLEPCPMCAGALIHARLTRLVFGAADPRTGAAGSVLQLLQNSAFNHQVETRGGVLAEASATLLREFFRARRRKRADAANAPNAD